MRRAMSTPSEHRLPSRYDAAGAVRSAEDELEPDEPEAAAGADSSIVAVCENHKYEIGVACLNMSDFSIEVRPLRPTA